ncbi:MAG: TetR/AcrR family transcriptional regulator [Acidimicrobiales bacterium]
MTKQNRSAPVMRAVLEAVSERLMVSDEILIRIPEICESTGVNYGSVYHHFGSREGVIDAAYNLIFSQIVEEDLVSLRQINESLETFDDYVDAIRPVLERISTGEGRVVRRAIRSRIVAAAITRPELRMLIGANQARLTEELLRIAQFAQLRGWMRRDVSAHSIAMLMQAVMLGRTLDDISSDPLSDGEWEQTLVSLFMEMLNLPLHTV